MLLVDVFLDRSPLEGIGVFARHAIARGTVIWKMHPQFDLLIPVAQWEAQEGAVKTYLDRYAYPSRQRPGFIVFEADDARYMNHSADPNCDVSHEDTHLALRDIAAGEEITCDYNRFFPEGFEFLGSR